MTIIGLIRHGITDWNYEGRTQGSADISLNDVGRQQAYAIANRLSQEEKWDTLISSDLSRAIETAEIIGSTIDLPINYTDKRIREIHCGEIEGTTEEERVKRWGHQWRKLGLRMETHESVFNRAKDALDGLIERHKEQ